MTKEQIQMLSDRVLHAMAKSTNPNGAFGKELEMVNEELDRRAESGSIDTTDLDFYDACCGDC